nr:Biomphalaria glabrata translation initiation factor IF-2-like [Biomphalaria glabrata]
MAHGYTNSNFQLEGFFVPSGHLDYTNTENYHKIDDCIKLKGYSFIRFDALEPAVEEGMELGLKAYPGIMDNVNWSKADYSIRRNQNMHSSPSSSSNHIHNRHCPYIPSVIFLFINSLRKLGPCLLGRADRTTRRSHIQRDRTTRRAHIQRDRTTRRAHIQRDRTTRRAHIQRDRTTRRAHIQMDRTTRRAQIQRDRTTRRAHIQRDRTTRRAHIQRDRTTRRAHIQRDRTTRRAHIQRDRTTRRAHIQRDRTTRRAHIQRDRTTRRAHIQRDRTTRRSHIQRFQWGLNRIACSRVML